MQLILECACRASFGSSHAFCTQDVPLDRSALCYAESKYNDALLYVQIFFTVFLAL